MLSDFARMSPDRARRKDARRDISSLLLFCQCVENEHALTLSSPRLTNVVGLLAPDAPQLLAQSLIQPAEQEHRRAHQQREVANAKELDRRLVC
jgi:hypothetical protein